MLHEKTFIVEEVMRDGEYRWRIVAAEIIGGFIGGGLLALVGGLIGRQLGSYSLTGWGDLVGVVVGIFVTYPLGVAFGNVWASRRFGGAGSLWRALLGSGVGVVVALALGGLLRLNVYPVLLWSVYGLLPPVLAALAQHVHQQNRSQPGPSSEP